MGMYRIEVNLCATLYVRAVSPTQAIRRAEDYAGTRSDPTGDDLLDDYDPRTDHVIISPAMTFYGRCEGNPEELNEEEADGFTPYFDR